MIREMVAIEEEDCDLDAAAVGQVAHPQARHPVHVRRRPPVRHPRYRQLSEILY